jgi:hypothetical protein
MRSKLVLAAAAVATLCVAMQPSRAAEASLQIAARGAAPSSIDVLSWSWGTSHPLAATAGRGTGRANVQDLSVVQTARETGSGMATGRQAAPASTAPVVGDEASLDLVVADGPAAAAIVGACASGEHLPSVSLANAGRVVQLSDAVVSSCTLQGGQRTLKVHGHVTLIK